MEIVAFLPKDHADAIELWRNTEGIGLSGADGREEIERYLARNPGMSFIAREDEAVVGAALCGHDGRRGYIHHLAVRADRRGNGIGKDLLARCLAALEHDGIRKCHVFVFSDNEAGGSFWRSRGWGRRDDLTVYSRDLG